MNNSEFLKTLPANATLLRFYPIQVTPQQIIDAVCRYEGLPYNERQTLIYFADNGTIGGYANCYGVLIQAAKDVGLLPGNFDNNLMPDLLGQRPAITLWQLLRLNFERVGKDEARLGDVLLMAYKDRIEPRWNEAHHVSMLITEKPLTMLHAAMTHGNGRGCVMRYVCDPGHDPVMWARVVEVWRMKNYG